MALAKLEAKFGPLPPVYVVGHSLGGALAAMVHALARRRFKGLNPEGQEVFPEFESHASYTFGMPRYGDNAAMRLPNPLHMFNDHDLVPTIPLSRQGYSQPIVERRLRSDGFVEEINARGDRAASWLTRANLVNGVRNHQMESYLVRLAKALRRT